MVTASRQTQKLTVYLHEHLAGHLTSDGVVYQFAYEKEYLARGDALPLSLSLPLTDDIYKGAFGGKQLPPYFFHLLPEGWLLNLAKALKLPVDQPMDLLALLAVETIGAVRIAKTAAIAPSQPYQLSSEPLILQGSPAAPAPYVRQHRLCLYCGRPLLSPGLNDNYHPNCAQELFGSAKAPRLTIDRHRIRDIAADQLAGGESLTGVQEKFSLKHRQDRKTIAPPLSCFVAKPQPEAKDLQELAMLEGAYMLFARSLGLPVARSGVLYLADATPCFISRRFDIAATGERIHQEDMAAPLGRYRKYESSHEGIAAILIANATLPPKEHHDDRASFLKMTMFNFLLGNTDAHLKNFALFHVLRDQKPAYRLTPYYDIFPSLLYAPRDTDELGLNLSSRKQRFTKRDFEGLARLLELGPRTVSAFIDTFKAAREILIRALEAYEISHEKQYAVLELARIRLQQLSD